MKKVILTALTTLSLFSVSNFSTPNIMKVSADENIVVIDGCSDVISDLKNLKVDYEKYLISSVNEIITMSQHYEDDGTLNTYVYVNSKRKNFDKLYANISTSISSNLDNITENFKYYEVELVSYDNNSNLKKYKILGLENLSQTTRRYNISNFYGTYTNDTPKSYYIDNLDEEVYLFNGTNNDNLKGLYNGAETITITDKEVGFLCYGDSLNFFGKETGYLDYGDIYNDTWYIFFNTDKEIDNLLEVEMTYTQYDFCVGSYSDNLKMDFAFTENWVKDFINNPPLAYQGSSFKDDFFINENQAKTLIIEPGTKVVSSVDKNFFGYQKTHYEELDNIMDLRKYQAQDDEAFVFTDYANKYTWGVHFNDTTREAIQKGSNAISALIYGSGVKDTAILRLKFETQGTIYNLSAIDTPTDDFFGDSAETPKDEDIDNLPGFVNQIVQDTNDLFDKLKEDTKQTIKIISAIVGVIILIWLLSFIIPFISKIIRRLKKKGGR